MGQLSGRSIRTFVLRQGRLTEGQQRSLDQFWSVFGIDVGGGDLIVKKPAADSHQREVVSSATGHTVDQAKDRKRSTASAEPDRIDLNQHFDNKAAPVWMEIGIGNGDALVYMAGNNSSVNFLGVEVHLPGVGHALGEVASAELANVRLIRYDVVDLIEHYMMPASVDRLLIYFPDPWHKTRHHKRRLVNKGFLDMAAILLRADGMIHFASDWVPYAEQVREVVAGHPLFECLPECDEARSITQLRPQTHFERRGMKLGHEVTDLVIRKIPNQT